MKVFPGTRFQVFEFCEGSNLRMVSCELRKSSRTRRINLRLKSPNLALLTFPRGMAWQEAENFLHDHKVWIQQKSLEFPVSISLVQHFLNGGTICLSPIIGEKKVQIKEDATITRPLIKMENQGIELFLPENFKEDMMVKKVVRKLASEFLPAWTEWAAGQAGLSPKKIRVGDQRSRWGSCSPKGTISLNWRIVLLSKELANYVIYHELAHLLVMNHSSKFWEKLEQFVPRARLLDRELTKSGRPVFCLGHLP